VFIFKPADQIPLGRQGLNKGPLCFDEIRSCLELARSSGVGISVPRALAGMSVSARSCSCICLAQPL